MVRRDKKTQRIVRSAIKFVILKRYKTAAQIMSIAGVSDLTIDRILYEPHNVRKNDLIHTYLKVNHASKK